MADNGIFFKWVGSKFHLPLLVSLIVSITINSGVTTSISTYLVGSLSAEQADITMAANAYAIGLVIGVPFILSLKKVLTSRNILLATFASLIVVNIVLVSTDQPLILVMASFVAGFLKIIGLLEILVSVIPILMPKGERYRFYAVYFPINLVVSQLATIVVVFAADKYGWQYGQLALAVPQLLAILVILFFVHPDYQENRNTMYTFDWLGLLLTGITMLLLDYLLSYGLTKDWLHSREIRVCIVFFLGSLAFLIGRTFLSEKPFLDLSVLQFRNVWVGLTAMFVLGLFFATNGIQSNLLNVILAGNFVENTRVNLYMIPGFIAATPIGFFYYRKYNGLKFTLSLVILFYLTYFGMLFFLTTPSATSEDFYLPMFFRGMAILLSYMAIGIYVSRGTTPSQAVTVLFYTLIIRVFVGPAVWSSVLAYVFYHRFINNIDVIAAKMDRVGQVYGGDQDFGAVAGNLVSRVQKQATLLAIREIMGMLIVVCIILIGGMVIATLFFRRQKKGTDSHRRKLGELFFFNTKPLDL